MGGSAGSEPTGAGALCTETGPDARRWAICCSNLAISLWRSSSRSMSASIRRASTWSSAFPPVKDEAQLSRGVVLPAANPEQLDLQLALIQSGLGLLPEGLQLLIQAIEEG